MICNEMAFFPANFILQTSHDQEDHHSSTSINPILQSCAPQDFHGVAPLLGKRSAVSFSGLHDIGDDTNLNGDDELSDDGSQIGEKKRRLNMEQVKTLEKNFELGNKLEPERKMQLARALGLQPRQIAIWFQNRRARWKTKQLEKDYDLLKRQYEIVKADNDALQAQNKKLHAEISALKNRVEAPAELLINLNKETEGSCSNRSENSSDINLDISRTPPAATDSPLSSNPIRPLFPSSVIRPASTNNNTVAAQFFQTTTTTSSSIKSEFQCQAQKMDSTTNNCVQDENFCNMFCGIDDQQGFWAWPEQQQFH